jgi:hypothetical protein
MAKERERNGKGERTIAPRREQWQRGKNNGTRERGDH